MMGINVDMVIVFTFFVGSALAGAAGVMNGLVYQNVTPYIGFQAGLKAFTAAVVGGIGNIRGAMLGGIMIGLAQTLTAGLPVVNVPGPDRLRDPDRVHARAADRPARDGGDPEGVRDDRRAPDDQPRPILRLRSRRAADRRRRVGRAFRRAAGKADRRARRRGAGRGTRPAGGSARRVRRRLRGDPVHHVERLRDPGRHRHHDLRSARDGAQRLSRLGGAPRPGLHRLLRLRRLRVRDAVVVAVRHPLGDLGVGAGRAGGDDPARAARFAECAAADRRLSRDRDAVLRSDLRHADDAGVPAVVLRHRRVAQHHRRPDRHHERRSVPHLRAPTDAGPRLPLGRSRRVRARRRRPSTSRTTRAPGAPGARCARTRSPRS